MPYVLGIDVGTCRTSAAIAYLDAPGGSEVDLVRLGNQTATVPSVLYVSQDGSVALGREPDGPDSAGAGWAVQGFSRRIGDDVPRSVGGEPCTAQALTATTVMWVVELVAAEVGAAADHIAITHPASWGAHRKELLMEALRDIGLRDVTLLPEPIAAAIGHAAGNRVDLGDVLAIYNLGAEEFDAAVVRRTGPVAFDQLGWASHGPQLGGADLDDALAEHVRAAVGPALADLDPTDPQVRLGMSWLRVECTRAKEELSGAGEATVLVQLPHLCTQVVVTRPQFEELILPLLGSTVDALRRTVRSAGLRPGELAAALLVGGSSRIPLVGELVSAELGCPVVTESAPDAAVAKGAALAARDLVRAARPQSALAGPVPAGPEPVADQAPGDQLVRRDHRLPAPPPRPPVEISPMCLPDRRSAVRRVPELKPSLLGAAVAIMIAVGVLLTVAGSALG
jgi:molecular chaperone DnaK